MHALADYGLMHVRLYEDVARLGVYDHDLTTGALTWDARIRALWGVEPDEPVTFDTFLAGYVWDQPTIRLSHTKALDEALPGISKYFIADSHAQQGAAQGRSGGDYYDLACRVINFKASGMGAEKKPPDVLFLVLQGYKRRQADRGVVVKWVQRQRAVTLQRRLDLLGAIGLTLCDVGGFQSGGVIFVVRDTLRVCGCRVGRLGSGGEYCQVRGQAGCNCLKKLYFGHFGGNTFGCSGFSPE